ncbi:MAG: DUF4190 domain-containing protein [Oscillospiraceae bacterium]|nr:DUF4190 domain-containing protein [Oscillospiraceae bacterium]
MEEKKSGLSTAGLVLGIIGICLSFIPIINNAAFVLGVLAAVFGIVGLVKKKGTGKAIAGLILGVLAIVITISMQAAALKAIDDAVNEIDGIVSEFNDDMGYITGDKTDDILANSLDVTLGKFEVVKGSFFDETKLTATLKNKSDEKKSFTVTVEAIEKDGTRITTDYIYATNLGAGQSQKFDIFTFVSSDIVDSLKNATFNVVEVSAY